MNRPLSAAECVCVCVPSLFFFATLDTSLQVDQAVMHFSMDGGILLKDSPEAMDQDEARAGLATMDTLKVKDALLQVLDKKQQEQTEKDSQEAIDEDFDPPENDKELT